MHGDRGPLALSQGRWGKQSKTREGAAPAVASGLGEYSRGRWLVEGKAWSGKRKMAEWHWVLCPEPHQMLWSVNG